MLFFTKDNVSGIKIILRETYIFNAKYKNMTKGNNILLAALGGAAIGALVASALNTEKGRQMLDSASASIKDLSGKATQYAKENIGEVVRETKESLGNIVKEKVAEQVKKESPQV